MEPYFKEYIFDEEVVVLPKYLNGDLMENLRLLLTNKYPKTFKNKGYISNIKVLSILDNIIKLSGQIIFKISIRSDLYIPEVNHTFTGQLKKGSDNKYQWVEIGPLIIYLINKIDLDAGSTITVKIVNIKSDNTLCFGKMIN